MTSVFSFNDITLAVEHWLYSAGGTPRHYEITTLAAMGTSVDNSLAALKALYEIDIGAFPGQDRYKEKLWLLAIKDPQAFLIARDKKGKAVGYMSIFGFKKNSRFLHDLEKKKEHALDLPDLLDYYTEIVARDKWTTDPIHIYIDAIAVKRGNRKTIQYPRAHLSLIARLIEDSKSWNTPIASISAIAVNKQGKSLCETLIHRRPKKTNKVKERYLYVRRFRRRPPTLFAWLSILVKQAQEHPQQAGKVVGFFLGLAEGYAKAKGASQGTNFLCFCGS